MCGPETGLEWFPPLVLGTLAFLLMGLCAGALCLVFKLVRR